MSSLWSLPEGSVTSLSRPSLPHSCSSSPFKCQSISPVRLLLRPASNLLLTIVLLATSLLSEFPTLTSADSLPEYSSAEFLARKLQSFSSAPLTPGAIPFNVTRPKGCVYNKQKYAHGDVVKTEQSCLKCTCKKGVLLCALRVCPPVQLVPLMENSNSSTGIGVSRQCRAVRDGNHCCPRMVCTDTPIGDSSSNLISDENVTPSVSLINIDKSILSGDSPSSSSESSLSSSTVSDKASDSKITDKSTVDNKTLPYQNRYPDKTENSPFLVSRFSSLNVLNAAPEVYSPDDEHLSTLLANAGNHCYLNGSFYEEGSAILSSTYCEYCYCIRSKRMCIRPRCHLSIMGCLPKYGSPYDCCPSSYACGNDALATSPIPAINLRLLDNPPETETLPPSPSTTTIESSGFSTTNFPTTIPATESPTTTTASTPPVTASLPTSVSSSVSSSLSASSSSSLPETTTSAPSQSTFESVTTLYAFNRPFSLFSIAARSMECEHDGQSYSVGDAMPSNQACSQCYCASNGERVCKLIHCSLPGDHNCLPIIPEGHCCPIEYRCEKPKSTPLATTLKGDPSRSRSLEPFPDSSASYPNINRVVNLLSSLISEIHRKPQTADSNDNELAITREMRSDAAYDNGKDLPARNANTFANGWKVIKNAGKNKNKFRSNPNRAFMQTTEKPKIIITTTISALPVSPIVSETEPAASETSSTALPETSSSPSSDARNTTDFSSTSKCVVDGKEYSSGEILPSSAANPCNYCRCFYGKEICQEQQCPSPPPNGCSSEKVEGQCCPTFTCKSSSEPDIATESTKPQIRRGPQYEPEIEPQKLPGFPLPSLEDVEPRVSQPPQTYQQPHPVSPPQPFRRLFPIDSLPRPIQHYQTAGGRIHFPQGPNGNSLPGISFPNGFPPSLIMSMHKNAMNKGNRLHFRPSQHIPQHVIPIQHQFQKQHPPKESPIRTLPQSPIQVPAQEENLKKDSENQQNSINSNADKGVEKDETSTSSPILAPTSTSTEKNPWDIFKISGCNIYGKVYRAGEKIDKLSEKCKQCICSSTGVQCKSTC